MAGILDNKTRIMDVVLTDEGKRQITSGELKIEFATFSDGQTFYLGDIISGSDDAASRLYLEACSLPRDQIAFEASDAGSLSTFTGGDIEVSGDGTIYSGSASSRLSPISSGSIFASLVDTVLSSSINNFKNLQTIGTKGFFDSDEFETDTDYFDFYISYESPFTEPATATAALDCIEPLFMDYRLSHIPAFAFLPPVIPADKTTSGVSSNWGTYSDLSQARVTEWSDLLSKVWPNYPDPDSIPQYSELNFTNTSNSNNLMCQIFESGGVSDNRLKKLDVIDFGEFTLENEPTKHAFFAGKVFIDSVGQPTFVNLFTIVFEKES